MSYLETIRYLDSFINYEKKKRYPYRQSFKLERMREFLRFLDNPQESFRSIHIAGTKGKGSVAVFTAYILKEAGYKVGLYTSPHLTEVRERIRILELKNSCSLRENNFEGMISKRYLAGLVSRMRPRIEAYNSRSRYGPLSFFEVYTALAFQYFKEKKIDIAVLETGLGGRLDATNVVQARICGITSISFDHTGKLGHTLAEIAAEKAGIIKYSPWSMVHRPRRKRKNEVAVVSAPQEKDVRRVIHAVCRRQGVRLYEIGKDIMCGNVRRNLMFQSFSVGGSAGRYAGLKIRLLGKHQIINASLALSLAVFTRKIYGMSIKSAAVRKGLFLTPWPGRFQIIAGSPCIVLDGAHNPASAEVLRNNIREYFPRKKIVLILGVSSDKDVGGICAELVPCSSEILLTRAHNPRAVSLFVLKSHVCKYARGAKVRTMKDITCALQKAKKETGNDSVIVITGSLFLVAEAKELLE